MLPVKRVDHVIFFFQKREMINFNLCRALIFASKTRLITVVGTYVETLC